MYIEVAMVVKEPFFSFFPFSSQMNASIDQESATNCRPTIKTLRLSLTQRHSDKLPSMFGLANNFSRYLFSKRVPWMLMFSGTAFASREFSPQMDAEVQGVLKCLFCVSKTSETSCITEMK